MLKSEGLMVFTTPNILGLDNRALGYNNMRYLAHALFPPMHLNAFSTQNIVHFLATHGFMVNEIETPGTLDIDNSVFQDVARLDQNTRALIQEFLVEMKMSSHMQCVATKS